MHLRVSFFAFVCRSEAHRLLVHLRPSHKRQLIAVPQATATGRHHWLEFPESLKFRPSAIAGAAATVMMTHTGRNEAQVMDAAGVEFLGKGTTRLVVTGSLTECRVDDLELHAPNANLTVAGLFRAGLLENARLHSWPAGAETETGSDAMITEFAPNEGRSFDGADLRGIRFAEPAIRQGLFLSQRALAFNPSMTLLDPMELPPDQSLDIHEQVVTAVRLKATDPSIRAHWITAAYNERLKVHKTLPKSSTMTRSEARVLRSLRFFGYGYDLAKPLKIFGVLATAAMATRVIVAMCLSGGNVDGFSVVDFSEAFVDLLDLGATVILSPVSLLRVRPEDDSILGFSRGFLTAYRLAMTVPALFALAAARNLIGPSR